MSFWGAHGIAIVATLWLLALAAGIGAMVVIAAGLPPMVFAVRCYILELQERNRRRR